jgi:hemolysin III
VVVFSFFLMNTRCSGLSVRSARMAFGSATFAAMELGDRGKARLDEAAERFADARETMAGKASDAREAMAERAADARDAMGEAAADAKERAAEAIAKVKPRLRGVSHEYAFFVSLVLGAALIVAAKGGEARLAVGIYAASLSALFGVSALYHRVNWRRPNVRRWMRRLDHTMIFFLIAGTVTPFALLVMEGPFATALLIAVWAGAAAGTVVELIWVEAPKWVTAIVYMAVGAIGAVGFPAIVVEAGVVAGLLIAFGGALYVAGAIIYAAQRPNPSPAVFGYHEIFHVLVIAAAAAHFAAVALFALPA